MVTHAFPRHAFLRHPDLMAHVAERRRPRFELSFPFRPQEGVVGLPLQAADLESLSVQLHHRFGLHPTDQRFAADLVFQRHRGCIGLNANDALEQTVFENHLRAIGSHVHPGSIRRRIDEPIRARGTGRGRDVDQQSSDCPKIRIPAHGKGEVDRNETGNIHGFAGTETETETGTGA